MTKQQSSKSRAEKVATTSAKITDDQLECLQGCFPEVFTEGKVDMDKLKDTLGDLTENGERYSFSWAGKKDAIRLLQVPSTATLVPDKKESVNFDSAQNLFIEGDNLEVLKLLYKSYFGRVKMIYIDPPYNTGNDFIYPDDFKDPLSTYMKITRQKDEEGNLLTSNAETNGRYHSSWLSMMYPRLFLSRQLLTEDGVIFLSIDDHEVHNLRMVMNEIFGEENFIAQLAVQLNPRGRHLDRFVARTHEHVLIFARSIDSQPLFALEKDERMLKEYNKEDKDGRYRELELRNRNPAFNSRTRPNLYYPIYVSPEAGTVALEPDAKHTTEVLPKNSTGADSCWTWSKTKFAQHNNLLLGRKSNGNDWRIFRKDYLIDTEGNTATTLPKALWTEKEIANDQGKKMVKELFDGKSVFDFPKSPLLIAKMMQIGSDAGDIILDFFAGSCSTAHAALLSNMDQEVKRKFIMVQLPETIESGSAASDFGCKNIADLGMERIRRTIKHLKSKEGCKFFRLSESNYRGWEGTDDRSLEAWGEQMKAFVDPLKDGWDAENVIFEVALKEGYSLNMQIEQVKDVKDATVCKVTDPEKEQSFYITLDSELDLSALKPLNLSKEDLFVCRDIALNDETSANLALQCRLKTI